MEDGYAEMRAGDAPGPTAAAMLRAELLAARVASKPFPYDPTVSRMRVNGQAGRPRNGAVALPRQPAVLPVELKGVAPMPLIPLTPGALVPVIPAALPAIPAVAGGLATAAGGLAGIYALLQGLGVQFPWETATGQGFIAPWTEMIETPGGWAALEGRQAITPPGGGDPVVSSWNTNPEDPRYGWTFYRLASGKMATMTKQGMWKTWRPKKHIVLPRGTTTLSQAVKAQRYLDRLWKTVAKRTKAIKLA